MKIQDVEYIYIYFKRFYCVIVFVYVGGYVPSAQICILLLGLHPKLTRPLGPWWTEAPAAPSGRTGTTVASASTQQDMQALSFVVFRG